MDQKVNPLVVALALLALAAAIFGFYRHYAPTAEIEHPGAADIPPRQPGDDKPATPPPGVTMPGTIRR